jgi:DNA-binding NtrC family response regulator
VSRVLLVEDDDAVARVCEQLIRDAGHDVTRAASVREAQRVMESDRRFDLAVVDIRLPDGSGLTLLPGFYAQRGRGPGVIVISGYIARDDIAGIPSDVIFLEKPHGVEQLAAALTRALPQHRED